MKAVVTGARIWRCMLSVLVLALLRPGLRAAEPADARGGLAGPDVTGLSRLPKRVYVQVHAVCIGIEDYLSPGVPTARAAASDAESMAELFRAKYGYEVTLLTGTEAARNRILEVIDQYVQGKGAGQGLGSDDALIVYFAGHGQTVATHDLHRTGYLIPYDAALVAGDTSEPDRWEREAINMIWLGEQARKMRCRHVLFLVDACYSGWLGARGDASARVDLREILARPSRAALTAGTEEQSAFGDAQLGHGVFTHYLIQQLTRDQMQSATEVFVDVRRQVAQHTEGAMTPMFWPMSFDSGEFVFIPRHLTDEQIAEETRRITDSLSERGLMQVTLEDLYRLDVTWDYRHTTQEARKARQWQTKRNRYEENAARGDPLAMAALNFCFEKGLGCERDPEQAFGWAQRAYDSGHPAGRYALARSYAYGIGIHKNVDTAMNLLESADAAEEFSPSVTLLAGMKLNRLIDAPNAAATVDTRLLVGLLETAAENGDLRAQTYLGNDYASGLPGLERDMAKGVKYITSAAQKKEPEALYWQHVIYYVGVPGFVEADYEESLAPLHESAELGYPRAQERLAWIYMGYGAKGAQAADFRLAERWALATAAKAERWPELAGAAMLYLLRIYRDGLTGPANMQRATECLQRAVELNHAHAYLISGTWYLDGGYYAKDEDKAITLFDTAGKLGLADGYYRAGLLYELKALRWESENRGRFVQITDSVNRRYAAMRYIQAARLGHDEAKKKVREYAQSFARDYVSALEALPPEETAADTDKP